MDPTDRSPDEETEAPPGGSSRPWGPGSPAPGAPVAAYDVGRDEEAKLEASEATALYEAARFPDLEEVSPAVKSSPRGGGAAADKAEKDGPADGLRILGVPAPKEIAGPILAALGLAVLLYGWRRRRRRHRR